MPKFGAEPTALICRARPIFVWIPVPCVVLHSKSSWIVSRFACRIIKDPAISGSFCYLKQVTLVCTFLCTQVYLPSTMADCKQELPASRVLPRGAIVEGMLDDNTISFIKHLRQERLSVRRKAVVEGMLDEREKMKLFELRDQVAGAQEREETD
jgi:hypothetical protein